MQGVIRSVKKVTTHLNITLLCQATFTKLHSQSQVTLLDLTGTNNHISVSLIWQ